MRPIYLLLRILLPYVMVIFYRRNKTLNSQKKFNAQTIFVSNHPSAFIDPLVAGNFQLPVLYFVTRGDIFKWWLKPITWASHMVPIFRQAEDGADSHEKNKDSFRYLRKVLMRKKSLILFGEGYTDDTFIRSLKIIKKGPARIGFDTMVDCDWKTDIKIQTVGLNYTHPKYFRSDVLVAFGDCIHLQDYKEIYEQSPSAAITQLTRAIQTSLQEQLTYVEDKSLAPFVENILILTRKGMNNFNFDKNISLENRYRYSQKVANTVNEQFDKNTALTALREKIDVYFKELKSKKIEENWVNRYAEKKSKGWIKEQILFWLSTPILLLGILHQFIPHLIVKRFVEKTFRRDVFWSGVKLLLGAAFSTLYNFPFIFLFYAYIYPSWLLALAYYLIVPALTGIFTYQEVKKFQNLKKFKKAKEADLKQFVEDRESILKDIKTLQLD